MNKVEISHCVLALKSPRDTEPARLEVACALYGVLGDELLKDDAVVVLNDTSLAGELIDMACQPKFSYAV